MESFFSLFVLMCLPLFCAFRHLQEYESFTHEFWGTPEKLATLTFISYVIFVIVIGEEQLYQYADSVRERNKFWLFFICPALSFAIAMFPKIAAEYSESYTQLASKGLLRTYAVFGWLGITWLLLILAI